MASKPDLYLHALSSEEMDLLRSIVAKATRSQKEDGASFAQKKLMTKSSFMVGGGDIRNFLKEGARPNPRFVKDIYEYVMQILYRELKSRNSDVLSLHHADILKDIEELYELGENSGRYARDITFYMNDFMSQNIENLNVISSDRGFYAGYRYSMDGSFIIRFFLHVFHDHQIDRSRFKCVLRLKSQKRETKGFAYSISGHTYLAGFINDGAGYEFITFKMAADVGMRAGMIVTTSSNGSPAAKQCLLIKAEHLEKLSWLKGRNDDTNLSDEEWRFICEEMTVTGEDWVVDVGLDLRTRVELEEFLDPTKLIRIGSRS